MSDVIFQLKITLKGSKPPIWRRVLVKNSINLTELHKTIQRSMGWYNSHLHQFIVGHEYYGEPMPDFDFDVEDESKVLLKHVLNQPKKKIIYEYDFGDSWEHEVLLEKIIAEVADTQYPQCIKGKGACPPEDVGGVWGYAEFLETIKDKNHPEHEEMLEWVGGDFDPIEFDLDEVNKALKYRA